MDQRKVCIVTGASSGIGLLAAKQLVVLGYHVILACRNKSKALEVEKNIKDSTGKDHVEFMELELASFQSVRNFVDAFHAKGLPLYALVNNAAVIGTPFSKSEDGIELTIATNHLGHFLLTNLLLGDLKKNSPSRIVIVSSEVHFPDVAGPGPFFRWTLDQINDEKEYKGGMAEYKNSKLANVWFCYELARRLEGSGVTCNCLNPGLIPTTALARNVPVEHKKQMIARVPELVRSDDHGMNSIVEPVHSSVWAKTTGKYFSDLKVTDSSPESYDVNKQKQLWDLSLVWTKLA